MLITNVIKFICIGFSIFMILLNIYATYYFTSMKYQLCVPINSCTYQVFLNVNTSRYYYNYVVNKQYKCQHYCNNMTDVNSCPINGSACHITTSILDYCRYSGFEALVACDDFMNVLMPILSVFLCVIFCLVLLILILTFFPNAEALADETHELYEEVA